MLGPSFRWGEEGARGREGAPGHKKAEGRDQRVGWRTAFDGGVPGSAEAPLDGRVFAAARRAGLALHPRAARTGLRAYFLAGALPTGMCLGIASGFLGTAMVSTPSLRSAFTLSASTPAGIVNERVKLPQERSVA